MNNVVWIAVGGALGAVARYLMVSAVQANCQGFKPCGTMFVNILGCVLVGMAMAWVSRSNAVGTPVHLFVVTGVLGGFTTFSAFGFETVSLIQEKQIGWALWNVIGNVGLGVPSVLLGHKVMEWLSR